jgi:hypothetical protein
MATVPIWRSRWADTGNIHGGSSSKRGQVFRGEIAEMNVLGADAFKIGLGPLRCTDGGEFGDEIVLTGLIQRLELRRVGMSQVVEVEWV